MPVKKQSAQPVSKKPIQTKVSAILRLAPALPFPQTAEPMLATLVDKPFDSDEWTYEIKWDGYRALAFISKDEKGTTF